MIALDTSALMAVIQNEPEAERCIVALEDGNRLLISAATVAEALVVSACRNVGDEMANLLGSLAVEIVPVTAASARRVGAIYGRWGKGFHPARLNFADCFAYDVAREHACPLLYVGGDFARTDIERTDLAGPD